MKYQEYNPANLGTPSLAPRGSAVASVGQSTTNEVVSALSQFEKTIGVLNNKFQGWQGQRDGAEDIRKARENQINEKSKLLDGIEKLSATNDGGNNDNAINQLRERLSKVDEKAYEKVKASTWTTYGNAYNSTAGSAYMNFLENDAKTYMAKSLIEAEDNPQAFAKAFGNYSQKLVDQAPTPELKDASNMLLQSMGTDGYNKLALEQASKLKVKNIQASEDAITQSSTNFIEAIVGQDGTEIAQAHSMLDVKLKSAVANGYISQEKADTIMDGTIKEADKKYFNNRVSELVTTGEINDDDVAENLIKPYIGTEVEAERRMQLFKFVSQENERERIATARFEAQQKQEIKDTSAGIRDNLFTTGEYLTTDIQGNKFLTFADKQQLLAMKKANLNGDKNFRIEDEVNWTAKSSEQDLLDLAEQGATPTYINKLLEVKHKQELFKSQLKYGGIHTPESKSLSDMFIKQAMETPVISAEIDEKGNGFVNIKLANKFEQARIEASAYASSLDVPIKAQQVAYAERYEKNLAVLAKDIQGGYKKRKQYLDKIAEHQRIIKEQQKITATDTYFRKGLSAISFNLSKHEENVREARAIILKNNEEIRKLNSKLKQIGFGANR